MGGGGEREVQDGGDIYIYIYMIHFIVPQKLLQHYKGK